AGAIAALAANSLGAFKVLCSCFSSAIWNHPFSVDSPEVIRPEVISLVTALLESFQGKPEFSFWTPGLWSVSSHPLSFHPPSRRFSLGGRSSPAPSAALPMRSRSMRASPAKSSCSARSRLRHDPKSPPSRSPGRPDLGRDARHRSHPDDPPCGCKRTCGTDLPVEAGPTPRAAQVLHDEIAETRTFIQCAEHNQSTAGGNPRVSCSGAP